MLRKSILLIAVAVLTLTGCQQESMDQAAAVVVRDSVASSDSNSRTLMLGIGQLSCPPTVCSNALTRQVLRILGSGQHSVKALTPGRATEIIHPFSFFLRGLRRCHQAAQ